MPVGHALDCLGPASASLRLFYTRVGLTLPTMLPFGLAAPTPSAPHFCLASAWRMGSSSGQPSRGFGSGRRTDGRADGLWPGIWPGGRRRHGLGGQGAMLYKY